jgi:uncharacterized protein (TIGR02270 family)
LPSVKLEAWARDELRVNQDPKAIAALLEVLASVAAPPPPLLAFLQHADPEVVAAAAGAARSADAQTHMVLMEHLVLEHPDLNVQQAAMLTALQWGSSHAWSACERLALDANAVHPLALGLCAALGTPAHHERIAGLLTSAMHRPHALFALGFSGNASQLPVLLDCVADKDPIAAKLALQALALITDLDLRDAALAQPEAPASDEAEAASALPPLEQDDLDAVLVPLPEDVLPVPDPVVVRARVEGSASGMDARRRHLRGGPMAGELLFHHLARGALRTRHVLALALRIRTRGQVRIDTRAFTAQQRAALSAARADSPRLPASPFSQY